MALTDLPACAPISVSTCLAGFTDNLTSETIAGIQAAIASVETELSKQIGKLGSAAANATEGLKKLQDQLSFIDEQIANIDTAINAISEYTKLTPCPDLVPIQSLLIAQRGVLEAQKAVFNLSGIEEGITVATDQRSLLSGYEDCLNVFKTIF